MMESMKIELPPIPEAERTPLVECLLAIIDKLQQHAQQLEETVQLLRDELAVLKGQKPRPTIQPSRLETPPAPPPAAAGQKRPGSPKRSKNACFAVVDEVLVLVRDAPPGSVHLGYEPYVVQELVLQAQVTRYQRQRVKNPDGSTVLAPLPAGVLPGRHFGPNLIAYILHQNHDCNVTQPLLLEQLQELGIDISAGQINRLLTEGHDGFHQEKAEVLTAGLAVSSYVGVDDTGARHEGRNGYCTALGNDFFAYFESTDNKSRLNFLQVLRGGCSGYTLNEVTWAYWERQQFPEDWVALLQAGPPVGQVSVRSTAIQVMPHAINPAPAATRPTPAGVFHERAAASFAAMIGTCETGGGSRSMMAAVMLARLFPSNALRPVTISYKTAPKEKISDRASASLPSSCSGDIY